MCARVYVVLSVKERRRNQAVRTLRTMPGVTMADAVDNGGGVVMVVEAPKRRRLAEVTVQAIASVETVTEEVQLLSARPTRSTPHAATKAVPPSSKTREEDM